MGGEHPDWLPVGWKVSVKVRSCGRKDKYYVNPSDGHKFNSKLEALRYLKSSGKDRKSKELNKINIEKTVAEKLPPGWVKETRISKKGRKTRRDPYYIDPVSGRHFRSMLEVFRYLESKDSEKAESKQDDKGHISVELEDHSQSSSAEAKAEGQRLIEKKADKNLTGHESVKSGLELANDLKSAAVNNVNMPEDNNVERREEDHSLAIQLSDKLHLVNRVKQHTDRMREIKKLADNKVDGSVDGDQRLKSGSKAAELKNVDTLEANYVEQRQREDDSASGNLPNKLSRAIGKEQPEGGRRQSKRLAGNKLKDNIIKDQSLQSGSEGAAVNKINMPETNGLQEREKENDSNRERRQHENLAHQNKRKNSNSKWMSDLPRRTSKRLARVEVDPSLEVKTSYKARAVAKLSDEAEVNTTKNIGKARLSYEPEIDTSGKFDKCNESIEHSTRCRTENPTNNKQKKPISRGEVSALEEHKGGVVDCKEDEKHEKHLDSSLKDLLMDPCIEFAIKTLTGAIPIEDVNKVGDSPVSSLASPNQTPASSSMLPAGDIWADPCFEFAVKTLTGEMPTEGGSQLEISFQQPLCSSGGASGCNSITLPQIRLDNFYPSKNYSFSQFDAVKKPYAREEGARDSRLPRAINGSSQNLSLYQPSPRH